MPTQKLLPVFVTSFHGGMNNREAPWLIGETQSTLIENLDVGVVGQQTLRRGVADFGARTDAPYGLWRAYDDVIRQDSLFSIYAGNIYITGAQGQLNQRACGASMANTLHQANTGRFAAREATFINSAQVADSDPTLASALLVITDDNLFTQNVSMAPRVAVWWQNRLWCADNIHGQNEETLWWSNLNDGLSYSSFNTAFIESGVGGRITALVPIRSAIAPQMLVFKERAVAVIETYWGQSSALLPIAADELDPIKSSIRLVVVNSGCVSTNSVQFVPGAPGGDIYFLSLDGVRAISRAQDDTLSGAGLPLSDQIQPTIDRINFEHADKAVSVVYRDAYYLAVPLDGATENTHILKFDMRRPGWSMHTWKAKAFANTRLNQTQPQMWMQTNTSTFDCSATGGASGFHIFQCFSGLLEPGGNPVIFQEATRASIGNELNVKKRWDFMSVFFRNDSLATMSIAMEHNLDNSSWITFASLVAGGDVGGAVILGVTPLSWGTRQGIFRRTKFSLSDVDPGYTLEIRLTSASSLAVPTIFNLGISAEMLNDTYDNEIS